MPTILGFLSPKNWTDSFKICLLFQPYSAVFQSKQLQEIDTIVCNNKLVILAIKEKTYHKKQLSPEYGKLCALKGPFDTVSQSSGSSK